MNVEIHLDGFILNFEEQNGWEMFNEDDTCVIFKFLLPCDRERFVDFYRSLRSTYRERDVSDSEYLHILKTLASKLYGQFSIVLGFPHLSIVVSDITRTFPVFYGKDRLNRWIISDRAEYVAQRISGYVDEFSLLEFKRAGYVTQHRTLITGVHQTEAGTMTLLPKDGAPQVIRHFTYASNVFYPSDRTNLLSAAQQVLFQAFSDYLPILKNRTTVVPLSGGYDSRLIACVLKELGVCDVVCYTYGSADSKEVQISKEVSTKLGFKWIYVPYSKELFQEVLSTGLFLDYLRHAHNYSALPHVQDLFATYYLKKHALVPENAIFVPGHTGDFYSGGHILPGLTLERQFDLRDAAELIYLYHFYLDVHTRKSAIVKKLQEQLENEAGNLHTLVEDWDLKNRQAKYIVNSLRVYEFFGYSHAIPLWHRKIANFFKYVSVEFKDVYTPEGLRKNLYVNTVREIFRRHDVDFEKDFTKKFKRLKLFEKSTRGLGRAVVKPLKDWLKENLPESIQSVALYLHRTVRKPFNDREHNFNELATLLNLEFYYRRSGILGSLVHVLLDLIKKENWRIFSDE